MNIRRAILSEWENGEKSIRGRKLPRRQAAEMSSRGRKSEPKGDYDEGYLTEQ